MEKEDAVEDFKRLFLEKTGNTWEAWRTKKGFEKKPGKFFPLEIDYMADHEATQMKEPEINKAIQGGLDDRVAALVALIFDVETYKQAMVEFDINVSAMPLGKLTARHIQEGFAVLADIQKALEETASADGGETAGQEREARLIDASSRFFTLIPSAKLNVIRTTAMLTEKVRMLETLRDIEVAARIIASGGTQTGAPLEAHYRQLACGLQPLEHNCEDWQLVERYLTSTHGPTHKAWDLALEEVFAVERHGEAEAFTPFKEKLPNRMLLWHGSRLSNYAGILSQGLRIAPPEAPTTGYMFGKGVYFADIVSKSAQYCYTSDGCGLLLLSEVALGKCHELRKAQYLDKAPRGKHSTKGVGRVHPAPDEHVTSWRDGVVVPCGRPVPSHVRATDLEYNEYIVYDTAQVKLQFLLKVRFIPKRR
eukprot:TRINITY_DN13397_c0_g2_i3.p1 TRINITY_DN13397_c0_g2~~TRINITY_DN13397_c0_g2_i3.p1  ORF type:complete len:422 (+),score=112.33 TRINITY_DN13397_c0_g2_i3:323-1588(+)